MTGKVTIDDLAREADCSPTQISRTLNGRPGVAPEMRTRILAAAKRLNYRNMANNHQIRVAVVISQLSGKFSSRLLQNVMNAAFELGWICLFFDERRLDTLDYFLFDGVISSVSDRKWVQKWVKERNQPLVMLNSYGLSFDHVCSVDPGRDDEAELVLRHLKSLGHRKIARVHFVDTGEENYHRGEKEFLDAAARLNLGDSARNFQFTRPMTHEDGLRFVLSQNFTAIYMIHQNLAALSAEIIQNAGYRIPEDVSLVTYEVQNISRFLSPPHTTIDFDYHSCPPGIG